MAKTTLTIQADGFEKTEAEIKNAVKDVWLNAGYKIKEIDTTEIYVKPEEKKVYYVINGTFSGSIDC